MSNIAKVYHIISYGCQMNEYDSARLAALLEFQGWLPAESAEKADMILVNTCSVRAKAEENAIARIRDLKKLRIENLELRIGVLGCMAKNRGESLRKDLPFIDFILGPEEYHKLSDILNSQFSILNSKTNDFAKLANNYSAFIAIQSGCNMRCSYCIVPYVRGMEKYRESDSILREIETAAVQGVSEITLLGQTVNGYRYKGLSFAGLLKLVADVKGIERIRFMSPHPKHYTSELLEILLNEPKIAPHVHLPAQSGSNSILKKMKRQYTRENYLSIVEALRSFNPLYGITTDIICGYPGETEEEFEETLSLLREAQFDSAFMFAYSAREGTPSAKEKELITETEKKSRLQKTIDLQNSITLERAKLMIGRTEKILLEKPSRRNPNEWVGKTGNFKKIIVNCSDAKLGTYVNCKIDSIK
ncbi:MAG: tRNA (N6-isopentenyl adenosine(37)-C2)-methylthiotransferase MiaB, partial [Fibromonadales bacterium]|nr:tRNA (N6-isopentenyl adenosine(37)-C2)-methylthiotransferase MiaB [Fibromonadales bacterium]